MKEFLEEELDKLKISKGEREILIEEFVEWRWEDFEEEFEKKNGRKPSVKEGKEFVKTYLGDNSVFRKPPMRQAEKERAIRQCLLDAIKRERKHLSVNEMSELLTRSGFTRGVSVKTIYKHVLGELSEYGIKKGSDGKYYFDDSWEQQHNINKEINRTEITPSEKKEQLTIISNFLESIKESPIYEKAKEFLDSEKRKVNFYETDEKENYSRILFLGAPEANINKDIWETIYKAMRNNKIINITYTAEGKKQSSVYKVKPYQLLFDNGIWELWADCLKENHKGRKLFNISRITKIEVLELSDSFELPKDFDFLHTMSGNFGCYNDEKLQRYKVKFYKNTYAWLYSKDRIWGNNQTIEETSDAFILSFDASQYKPILRWILGWGEEVIPLEPVELLKDWKMKVLNMFKNISS